MINKRLLKNIRFRDKFDESMFKSKCILSAEDALCRFVNENEVKVVGIGSGWNKIADEFTLFYKEKEKQK